MSLVIASISCSKSEDKVIKEEISDTFSATIKDGFTGEKWRRTHLAQKS